MLTQFRATLRPALVLLALFTLVTGIVYPLAVTAIARIAMPQAAGGSLIRDARGVRGSALIGQSFVSPGYFHGRPSAAGTGYDAANSGASNFAPGAPELRQRIVGDIATLRKEGLTGATVPADLVTTSASGLDPDISPAAALVQVPRVARARGMSEAEVAALVRAAIQPAPLGILGPARVNVLGLNLRLDAAAPPRVPSRATLQAPSTAPAGPAKPPA